MAPFVRNFFAAHQEMTVFPWEEARSQPGNLSVSTLEALRINAFRLELLGRVIRKASKKKKRLIQVGEVLKTHAKTIEDIFGDFLFFHEMKVASAGLDSACQVAADQDLNRAGETFSESLRDVEGHLEEISRALDTLVGFGLDLRKTYLKGLRRCLKKIHMVVSSEIDPQQLEDGTHELRRQLRWVPMGYLYPKGLFEYSDTSFKGVDSKYTQLYPNPEDDPHKVDPAPLVGISRIVGQLGHVKDHGLIGNHFAFVKNPEKKVDWNKSYPKAIALTEAVLEELKAEKYLPHLIKNLKVTKK